MSVNDVSRYPFLKDELKTIEFWLKTDRPLLGICLGSQLIAKALGEKIYRSPKAEIGWIPVQFTHETSSYPILDEFYPEQPVFQWHYDTFDLPENSVLLASSVICKNQAFRFGKKAYGIQFHPEINENLIHNWVETQHHKLLTIDSSLPHKILSNTNTYLKNSEKMGQKMIQKLCKMI